MKRSENKGSGITTLVWDGADYWGEVTDGTMTTRFYTINSQMMAYEKSGVWKDFLTDMLGLITAEMGQTQTRTYESRYSAYGRNNWSTGTGSGFGWVGSFGYRETGLFNNSHYVRSRHYSYLTGMWTTIDPLWPEESAYGCVDGGASRGLDYFGLEVMTIGIGAGVATAGVGAALVIIGGSVLVIGGAVLALCALFPSRCPIPTMAPNSVQTESAV